MPATYTDQFFVMDPGVPPSAGTALQAQNFDFVDQNDDGQIGTGVGDTFNGLTITSVWVGDTITVDIPGFGQTTITGVTFYVSGGPAVFTPADGTILEDAVFVSSTFVTSSTEIPVEPLAPVCFGRGTMIETVSGPRPVEGLRPGELVLTLDNGPQPVLLVEREYFEAKGSAVPVRIAKGVFGNTTDLILSQQHRILVSDWRAQYYFGEDEVFVAAKYLINGDTVTFLDCEDVEYFHVLFSEHQVIWSAGALSESYCPTHFAERRGRKTLADALNSVGMSRVCSASDKAETHRRSLKKHEAVLLAA